MGREEPWAGRTLDCHADSPNGVTPSRGSLLKTHCIRQKWPGSGIPTTLSHWLGETRRSRASARSPGRIWRHRRWRLSVSRTPGQVLLHSDPSNAPPREHNPHSTSVYCLLGSGIICAGWQRHSPWFLPWFLGNHSSRTGWSVHFHCQLIQRNVPQVGGGWDWSLTASWESLATGWSQRVGEVWVVTGKGRKQIRQWEQGDREIRDWCSGLESRNGGLARK